MFLRQSLQLLQGSVRPTCHQFQRIARASIYRRKQHLVIADDHFDRIRAKIDENRALSATEWTELRNELMATSASSSTSAINEVNIDANILGQCLPDGRLTAGKSYVRFLRDTGREPNLATLGRLLRLYHMGATKNELSSDDREEIVRIVRDLQAKSPAGYDSITSENMLHALVTTPAWRDAIALLHSIRLTAKPSTSAYSLLAARAFAEHETDVGWQVLNACVAAERLPRCEAFVAYLQMCQQRYADQPSAAVDAVTTMLKFIGQHNLVISQTVIDELQRLFGASTEHRCKVVNIGEHGQCPMCRRQLRSVFLTNAEFKQISSTFLDRVLVRNDAFVKSSPAEVRKFEQFLRAQAKFDCVIDGLNVAYSTGNNKSPAHYGKLVAAVVRYFVEQNKRVLVLGRKHMLRWPKGGMGYVQANAKLFLTDDLSQDDPFLLYATLKSGPSTDFVSRDLMRGHAHLLGPELKPIFRRWQQEHQYCLEMDSHPDNVNIREPIKFQTNAHTMDGCWHIPCTDVYDPTPPETFTLPSKWLCIAPSN